MSEKQLAAEVAKGSVKTLREALAEMKVGELNILHIDPDGSITVINWDKRQFESDDGTARSRRSRERAKAVMQQNATSQIVAATETQQISSVSVPSLIPEDVSRSRELPEEAEGYLARELCGRLAAKIKGNNPKAREPNLSVWAKDMDKLLRIDRRTAEDVRAVIDWCQQDSFWCGNILSPAKLRKQFDALTMQMQRKVKADEPKGFDAIRERRAERERERDLLGRDADNSLGKL